MKRLCTVFLAAVLVLCAAAPVFAESSRRVTPEWFSSADLNKWWATESYTEDQTRWQAQIGYDWVNRIETQHNDPVYYTQINLKQQTAAFLKGSADFDTTVWLKIARQGLSYEQIEIGTVAAGNFDTAFDISKNSALNLLCDAQGSLTVTGLVFTFDTAAGNKLQIERFSFGSGTGYNENDVNKSPVNWFEQGREDSCWWSWDWCHGTVGGRFFITYPSVQKRFSLSVDDTGWHYTPHSMENDAGTAASYGTGTGITLAETPNVELHYTAPCRAAFRLRIYAVSDTGGITGEAVTVEIGTLLPGTHRLNVNLSKINAVKALANSNGWIYVSGVEFTTGGFSPEATMTFSQMYFCSVSTAAMGDFNEDGSRDNDDISFLKAAWLGGSPLSAVSDFNEDGATDICDAVLLKMALSGMSKPVAAEKGVTVPDEEGYNTYYVDSASGNDSQNGLSEKQAWKTLKNINNGAFSPGTRILLKRGSVFTGTLTLQSSGNQNGYIVVDSYGSGAKPIINGNGATYAVLISDAQYIEIRNLEITNTAATNARRMGIYVNAGGAASAGGTFRHIYLENLDVHDVSANEGDRWTGGIVFVCNVAASPVNFSDVLVEGCTVMNTPGNGITLTSDYNNRNGVGWGQTDYYPSTNVILRNNFISAAAGDGIFFNCIDGGLMEYNVVSGCCFANGAYAGMWPHNASNITMQYNEAYGTRLVGGDGQGYDVDINCRNTVVQYNYSHDNEGGFLLLCTDGTVDSFHENTIVRYNVSRNDLSQIFTLSGPISGISIYNNTVDTASGLKTNLIGSYDWGDGRNPQSVSLWNNIFNMSSTGSDTFRDSAQVSFDNNQLFGKYPFSSATSVGSISGDPMFKDPDIAGSGIASAAGYRLREGSPCIDAGKTVGNSGMQDYAGNWLLTDGKPDIGAFEYVP